MKTKTEKRVLQSVVALACLVPILGGFAGMWDGTGGPQAADINLDSHFRYLSGLLFGIGIAFATTVPGIERKAGRFRILTMIVVFGGLARLLGVFLAGLPSTGMLAALGMELAVTPALCLWQTSFARRFNAQTG